MRKGIALIIAVLVLSVPGMVSAQMNNEEGMGDDKGMRMMDHGLLKDDMMDKGGMMGGPMIKPMKEFRMEPRVIPTTDGGVVVLMGDKMSKYDQDLDLIGQADIKADMEGMKKRKGGCPMMGHGPMDKMEDEPQAAAADKEVEAKPEAAVQPVAVTETKTETAVQPTGVTEHTTESKPAAAAEPAITWPASETKPDTAAQPASAEPTVKNSTNAIDEWNHAEQK